MTSTEVSVRRAAVVLAGHRAVPPPGIGADGFARAALADCYEVAAGLQGVVSGIAGAVDAADLVWPDAVLLPAATTPHQVATAVAGDTDQLVVLPADAPDLPGLVLAKVFRALSRAKVCLAPERGGPGCVALGVRLPWPYWLPVATGLDDDPYARLRPPRRSLLTRGPDWHRLRSPEAVSRLDPGLEGWEETRAMLSGTPLAT